MPPISALAAEAVAARAALSPATAARVGGTVLVVAGLYQLTPWHHEYRRHGGYHARHIRRENLALGSRGGSRAAAVLIAYGSVVVAAPQFLPTFPAGHAMGMPAGMQMDMPKPE